MTMVATWPTFPSALLGRELVADRTMAFRFAKPAGWSYRAGQFVDLTLIEPPETDAEGNTRGFSISSAPTENVIMITTRLRDTAFKRVLQELPLGTAVKVEGPFGDLRLHHAARPAVLLAGGIGITPFRSILVEMIGTAGLPYRVVLFHANRRPEDAAFADEFRALERVDPNLTFVPTMTAMAASTKLWTESGVTSTPRCCGGIWVASPTRSSMSPARPPWSKRCEPCFSRWGPTRTTSGPRSSPVTEPRPSRSRSTLASARARCVERGELMYPTPTT
jgi:ferredoxin-NADP reductase